MTWQASPGSVFLQVSSMQELAPLVLFGFSLLVLGWVIFRMIQRQGRSRSRQSPRQQVAEVRQQFDRRASRVERPISDAPSDMQRWQVEMHETTRELRGQLDSKIAVLNASIRLAEEKIQQLKRLVEAAEAADDQTQRHTSYEPKRRL